MDLNTDKSKCFSARVDIMQPRFGCSNVPTKLLVDTIVGLRHCFVGIVDTTATGDPCSETPTALTPTMKTLTIARDF